MSRPGVGEIYDLTFARLPGKKVRVEIVAGDEETPRTPCGARTIPIRIIEGEIPKADTPDRPAHVVGPGQVTSMPLFIPTWTLVPRVRAVFLFGNGMMAVTDLRGNQIGALQGPTSPELIRKIERQCSPATQWHGLDVADDRFGHRVE